MCRCISLDQRHVDRSTRGVFECFGLSKDLISKETQMKAIPTMCNWNTFQSAPNKIYNVPVLMSVWNLDKLL